MTTPVSEIQAAVLEVAARHQGMQASFRLRSLPINELRTLKALRMSKAAWPVVAVIFVLLGCRAAPVYLDMATTTSVENSGLLNALLPHFERATVRVHLVGGGLALKMLSDGKVDIVISHAPETERRYLAQHPEWVYRKVAFNQFLLVGPEDGPAHVRDAADVIDAFRRIAASDATFVDFSERID